MILACTGAAGTIRITKIRSSRRCSETDRGKALQSALQFAQRVRTLVGAEHDEAHAAFRSMTEAIQKCWGKIESLDESESIDKAIEALYAAMAPESGYLLKPMNCPHHIAIYAARASELSRVAVADW